MGQNRKEKLLFESESKYGVKFDLIIEHYSKHHHGPLTSKSHSSSFVKI